MYTKRTQEILFSLCTMRQKKHIAIRKPEICNAKVALSDAASATFAWAEWHFRLRKCRIDISKVPLCGGRSGTLL